MHTSRRSLLVALTTAAVLLIPTPADAQLGGFIKRRVADRIADKALGEGSERRAPAPKFDDTVLEITGPRLDQLLRGVDAEGPALASARQAEAQSRQQGQARKAQYEAEMREYDRKSKEYDAAANKYMQCQMASLGAGMRAGGGTSPEMMRVMQKMAAVPEAEREALGKRIEARQAQMEAAEKRGDQATRMRLAEEMDADLQKTAGISFAELQGASAKSAVGVQAMQAEQAKCGTEPVPPVEPQDPTRGTIDVRDSVRTAAFRASGLDDAQYTTMRERVSAWLAHKEKNRSLGSYGFTDDELKLLEERIDALKSRKSALLGEDRDNQWSF